MGLGLHTGGEASRVVLDRLLRAGEGRILRRLKGIADQVNAVEDDFVALSDAELRAETDTLKARHADGESLDDLLPEAFGAVREAARRTLGQRHFDVQLMGGAALHLGNIAEMRTGEGKTLVSTLPVYLNALTGKGVHVVTVNDYLARRDAEWMGRVHRFLGLEVGVILANERPDQRRPAYACDVTYGTNNEFGFDYLRDNMAWGADELVQRGHHFAVVDEVDSILIDEARTPLIISGPADQATKWYTDFARIVPRLKRDVDYEVEEGKRTVAIGESGVEKVEDELGIDNLYEAVNTPLVGYLNNALKARELYHKDKDYIVSDGEVLIVDEFTGRVLHGRRYSEGMHQAIEAKERVVIKDENQTLATITLQNYFRLYAKLGGMTGTAMTEASEFSQIYKLGVVSIPTNMDPARVDEPDVIFKTEDAKFDAVVDDIAERNEQGQPVLVGTTSVAKSERLSTLLTKRGVPHSVLNAKFHEQEAQIVAQAGRLNGVTVATNMAGRGTDIMLGGNPEFMAAAELAARGLSPVETPEDYEAAWAAALEKAQAEVEEEHDDVVGLGGLYVLGTERHESRRIDNQLRGRSGRQGDPGESRFYLSLGDDLMRLFNASAVEMIMDRLSIPDDMPIESKMVTRAIRSAQSQVEGQNFEIRKNVLKYDEVLNTQREVIYAERRKVLEGADLHEQIRHMIDDVTHSYVTGATAEGYAEDWDLDKLWAALRTLYPVGLEIEDFEDDDGGRGSLSAEHLAEELVADAQEAYDRREASLGDEVMRELERRVVLSVLDRKWREHLYEMDYLQEGIGLRAMAQRDPLVEYKREGHLMFEAMLDGIKEESVGFLFNLEVAVQEQPQPGSVAVVGGTAEHAGAAEHTGGVAGEPVPSAAPAAFVDVPSEAAPSAAANGTGEAGAGETGATPTQPEEHGDTPEAGVGPATVAAAFGADPEPATGARRPAAKDLSALLPKGLGAPQRSTQLQYTAPSTDGTGAATVTHGETQVPSGASGGLLAEDGDEPARNAPCPCGSGRKYKRCHGSAKGR